MTDRTVNLPADTTLTTDNFSVNSDGTVTIKNNELNDLLRRSLEDSVADNQVAAVSVGVTVGT